MFGGDCKECWNGFGNGICPCCEVGGIIFGENNGGNPGGNWGGPPINDGGNIP